MHTVRAAAVKCIAANALEGCSMVVAIPVAELEFRVVISITSATQRCSDEVDDEKVERRVSVGVGLDCYRLFEIFAAVAAATTAGCAVASYARSGTSSSCFNNSNANASCRNGYCRAACRQNRNA